MKTKRWGDFEAKASGAYIYRGERITLAEGMLRLCWIRAGVMDFFNHAILQSAICVPILESPSLRDNSASVERSFAMKNI